MTELVRKTAREKLDKPTISTPSSNVVLTSSNESILFINPTIDIDLTLPSDFQGYFKIYNSTENRITIKSSNGDTVDSMANGFIEIMALSATPATGADWIVIDIEEEGIVTPVISNYVNLTGNTAPITSQYNRKKGFVTVSFRINADPSSGNSTPTITSFDMEIPLDRNSGAFISSAEASGVAGISTGTPGPVNAEASAARITAVSNNIVRVEWNHTNGGGGAVQFAVAGMYRYEM